MIDYYCWFSVARHAQTYLNLSGSDFAWPEGDIFTLKIIQNKRLMEFQGSGSVFFPMHYIKLQIIE